MYVCVCVCVCGWVCLSLCYKNTIYLSLYVCLHPCSLVISLLSSLFSLSLCVSFFHPLSLDGLPQKANISRLPCICSTVFLRGDARQRQPTRPAGRLQRMEIHLIRSQTVLYLGENHACCAIHIMNSCQIMSSQ